MRGIEKQGGCIRAHAAHVPPASLENNGRPPFALLGIAAYAIGLQLPASRLCTPTATGHRCVTATLLQHTHCARSGQHEQPALSRRRSATALHRPCRCDTSCESALRRSLSPACAAACRAAHAGQAGITNLPSRRRKGGGPPRAAAAACCRRRLLPPPAAAAAWRQGLPACSCRQAPALPIHRALPCRSRQLQQRNQQRQHPPALAPAAGTKRRSMT
jgi:hypothetical protein